VKEKAPAHRARRLAGTLVRRLGAHRASLAASVGALLILVALGLAAAVAASRTENGIERSVRHAEVGGAIYGAHAAIGRLHDAVDVYTGDPGPDTAAALERAQANLRSRLADATRIAGIDGARARAFAGEVDTLLERYRESPAASADQPRSERVHALLSAYDSRLVTRQEREADAALAHVATLETAQERMLVAVPIALVLGIGALIVLWLVAQEIRRQTARRDTELEVRAREALTDELTGARNLRAFRQDLDAAIEQHRREAVPLTLVSLDVDGLKALNDSHGHQAGDELLKRLAAAAQRTIRGADRLYRTGGDEFALLLQGTGAWGALTLVQRLHLELAGAHDHAVVRVTAGVAEAEPGAGCRSLMRAADTALLAAKRAGRTTELYSPQVEDDARQARATRSGHYTRTLATALARAVDAKDSYTKSHSETVSALCGLIAAELGLEPQRIDRLKIAGLLHDVGKIGISDAILQKPDRLTCDEFETMKTHATIGHGIVSCADFEDEATWVRHHHERVDGRGYPDGLAGEAIPLESRIILVADAFEAMTADRPYRRGMPTDVALAELRRNAGSQFDPECAAALERALLHEAVLGATRPRAAEVQA